MRPLLRRRLLAALFCLLPLPALAAPQAYVSAWNTLYRLDLATGQATPVGTGIGFNDVEGLAFAPDGTLYGVADGTAGSGSASTDFLIRIDTATGTGTGLVARAEITRCSRRMSWALESTWPRGGRRTISGRAAPSTA